MIKEKRQNKRWTIQEDETLMSMIREGKCAPEIAKALNRTTHAVWSRKYFLGDHDVRIKVASGENRKVRVTSGTTRKIRTVVNENGVSTGYTFNAQVEIHPGLVGAFIGPKGSHISSVGEQFGVSVRIDGSTGEDIITIRGNSEKDVESCRAYVEDMVKIPEVGECFTGRVANVASYGAFISIKGIHHGLCHASQITGEPIDKVSDHLAVGDEVRVEVIGINGFKPVLSMSTPALKEVAITSLSVIEGDPEVVEVLSPREITTEMTRLARQLARSNGQRMVLAVYFVDSGN